MSTTAKQKTTVDVLAPDPNFRSREWDWHVWERIDKRTQRWLGFFRDTETALAWVRANPGNYEISNVPPMSSSQRIKTDWRQPETKTRKTKTTFAAPKATPAKKPVAPQPKPVNAKAAAELKAAKQDAKVILDKHHADEALELAAEGQG